MGSSGRSSSEPPPGGRPFRKPRSFTPLATMRARVEEGAKELVVDDFVDTFLQERPKTDPPSVHAFPTVPAPPAEPPPRAAEPEQEESGVRKAAGLADREAEAEVSIAEHEADLVAMEAQLADRDDRISHLEQELARLRGDLASAPSSGGALASPEPPRHGARPLAAEAGATPAIGELPVASAAGALPIAPPSTTSPLGASPPAPARPVAAPPRARGGSRAPRGRILLAAALALGAVASLAKVAIDHTRGAPAELAERSGVKQDPRGPEEPGKPRNAEAPARTAGAAPSDTTAARAEAAAAPPPGAPTPSGAAPTPAEAAQAPAAPPEAPLAPSATTPPAAEEPPPKLLSFQGLLTVTSPIDAEVVVQGQPVGRTNQRLLTRCGPRNVRLRQDGAWVSAGEHVRITCMEHTTVAIAPSP